MVKIEIDPELDHDEKTEPNLPPCSSHRCEGKPTLRFTWPGRNQQVVCAPCAVRAVEVADALGFHLELLPYP